MEEFREPDASATHYFTNGIVSTVGLITALNPRGERQSDRMNYESNSKLLQDIRSLGCGVTVSPGMYEGHRGETFLITNITESDIIALSYRHGQKAAIWGYLRQNAEGDFFVMLYLEFGKVLGQRRMEVALEDVQNKETFFSAFKSGRIRLPDFKPEKNART